MPVSQVSGARSRAPCPRRGAAHSARWPHRDGLRPRRASSDPASDRTLKTTPDRIAHNVYLAAQSAPKVELPGSQGRERFLDEVSRLAPGGVPAPGTETQSPGTAASQPDQRRVSGSPQGSPHGVTPCAPGATAAGDDALRCLTPELCPEKGSQRRNCSTPSDTCSWITPDDVCAAALSAVFAARRGMQNPQGEPWLYEGESWSKREDFANELVCLFAEAIDRHAALAGLADDWLSDGGYLLPAMRREVAP